MIEIGKPLLVVYAVAALAIALIGARYLQGTSNGGAAGGSRSTVVELPGGGRGTDAKPTRRLVVHVVGAVRRPGLVEVSDGARVGDAIRRAGGPARAADLTAVNLAMRVADGQQVLVPAHRPQVMASGASPAAGPISLNAATSEQLDTLDGVGPGLAQKIIAARDQRGGFRTVDDLADVPGIGEKRLESLRAQLQP